VGRLDGRTLILDADRGGLGWNSRTLSDAVDDLLVLLQQNENGLAGMVATQDAVLVQILGADRTQWANRMRDEPETAAAVRAILDARTWALNTTVAMEQMLVSTAIDLAMFAVPADVILAWAWRESRIAADFATSRFTTRTGRYPRRGRIAGVGPRLPAAQRRADRTRFAGGARGGGKAVQCQN